MEQMPLRVVLAGCGSICRAWLDHAMTRTDLTVIGLVDLHLPQAESVRDRYAMTEVRLDTDLDRALEDLKPDLLFNCTVPQAHVEVTLTGLFHGCHVLGEKPMATSMADARRIVDAAAETGLTYAVIQNRRYLDAIVHYRNWVQSDRIGRLTTLNADFYLGPHFGGFRDEMEHVLLVDMAIHSFDQARLISGEDPVSVYCHEWNPPGSWYAHGASAVAIFEMTNDVVFTYRGSWCAQGLPTAWACDWRAVGTTGTLTWDGEESIAGEAVDSREGFFYPTRSLDVNAAPPLPYTGHAGVINDFVTSVRAGTTPQTVCTDNIKSLAMVLAAVESAETGRTIEITW
jgi:predicted dehydrogenase